MKQSLYGFNKKSIQINVSQNNNITRKINVNETDKINEYNLQKTLKKVTFIDKFTSKALTSDENYSFNFKTAKWSLTIIYIVSFIAIPILYSIIKSYAFHNKSNDFLDIFIYYLLPILGLIVSLAIDNQTMIRKGGWAAYTHCIFGFISMIFASIFLISTKLISGKSDDVNSIATMFLIQQLFQLIGSILVITFCKSLRARIIATIKGAKLDLITWITIFLVIGTVLNVLINLIPQFTSTNLLTDNDTSKNQDNLNLLMKTPYGIFSLILGTIFIAPLNEEISYRHGTFTIVRYRWLGYVASLIYFPSMHVMDGGDWNHIVGYLAIGALLPLLFVMTRGNVTYTIGLHAFSNILATATGFIK
ncbi:CPBP family glutamic-type intramembrane protease [Spiroplasma endosymbiont of Virgichneumon dumeticola]|uniref:CPBP family glutamic-type intramembrane protease n=1 Tax=Spiroplasma endosymbiont of Virgichneumon dumeticola TaxID=3139323 RepID=UPI0035C8A8F7